MFGSLNPGLELAGALFCLLLCGFTAMRVPEKPLAWLPIAYFVSLACGLALPLLGYGGGPAPLRALLWFGEACVPALAYLLVLQLLDAEVPPPKHLAVLLIPIIAMPVIMGTTHLGTGTACVGGDVCIDAASLMSLYDAVAGGGILLALMLTVSPRLADLATAEWGREKRVVILTIVLVQAVALGVDLLAVTLGLAQSTSDFLATMLRLTFIYLVASSVFRVFPGAFRMPEPPPPEAKPVERKALSGGETEILDRIGQLMTLDKLYQEPGFNRKQLADEVGVPEHQLSRIINTGFGKSFTELVNDHRVAEAKQLLRDSAQPVSQIAFDVGFNSLASFNRVFKTATGLSPTGFREGKAPGSEPLGAADALSG